MKKSKYQSNDDWKKLGDSIYSNMVKQLKEQPKMIYESEKVYVDGVAIKGKNGNKDIWYRFNLFTTRSGRKKIGDKKYEKVNFVSNKIYCSNCISIIKILYKYSIMLKKCGSSLWNTKYCIVRFIEKNMLMLDGMFKCDAEHQRLIGRMVNRVYEREDLEVDSSLVDNRKFCIDKDNCDTNIRSKQQKTKGDLTYERFKEIYTEDMSKAILASRLKLSIKQISNLIKRYNEENSGD